MYIISLYETNNSACTFVPEKSFQNENRTWMWAQCKAALWILPGLIVIRNNKKEFKALWISKSTHASYRFCTRNSQQSSRTFNCLFYIERSFWIRSLPFFFLFLYCAMINIVVCDVSWRLCTMRNTIKFQIKKDIVTHLVDYVWAWTDACVRACAYITVLVSPRSTCGNFSCN